MNVIKRDGSLVKFDKSKISSAIMKAMRYGSGIVNMTIPFSIADEIERYALSIKDERTITVKEIEDLVYTKLVESGEILTAKAYEGYRAIQEYKRRNNTTDDSIMGLVERVNEEVLNENSNKNGILASTQRDLIAGEVSKDITRRKLLPARVVQAHDEGIIHFHK